MGWIIGVVVAIVVTALILYIIGTWNHNYFKKHQFPFVKNNLPFIGAMGPLAMQSKSFADLIRDIYNEYENYKYVGFFDFGIPSVMIRDPEMIKMVTVKDFEHFVDRISPITEDVDPLFGKNLLSLQGQRWKDMRNMLSPAFTSSKMKAMYMLICESGDQMVNYLEKTIKGEKSGVLELNMKDFFTRYANDVIATAAFGVTCDSLENPNNEFYLTGKDATNFSGVTRGLIFTGFRIAPSFMKFLGMTLFPKKVSDFFYNLVSNNIDQREREGIVRPDMIHLMMEARKDQEAEDHSEEEGEHKHRKKMELSVMDMTAQALLFFFGGFDSSSTHLCYVTQLLAIHPEVQQRLHEEIDAHLEAEGGKLTYEAVNNMKYLDMCISEALRLWPPGAISNRQCVKPYVLPATENTPSFRIEKGMGAWMPIYAIHRDPKYFPDPERFDPERFSDENKHNIQPYTYMPFGTGPRNCIGMRFALMETKVAIVKLLSKFDIVVTEKTQTKPKLVKNGFAFVIEGGFWVGMKPRTKNN